MVAVRTGGSIGTGGGGAAVAHRGGGGGVESRGGFSGARSFGNTARFESSFSGRSLATDAKVSERRSSPSISISKTGKNENNYGSKPRINASRERRSPQKISSLAKTYGPKVEAVRGFSQDTNRAHVSALKETRPMYESKADAKYHSIPGHAKVHTEPAHAKPKGIRRSEHPLYARTETYLATGNRISDKKSTPGQRSLYERRLSPIDPKTQKFVIAPRGERTITSVQSSKTTENNLPTHNRPQVTSDVQKNKVPEAKKSPQLTKDKAKNTTSPVELQNKTQLDNRVREQLQPDSLKQTMQSKTPDLTTKAARTEPQAVGTITSTETQKVLNAYVERYAEKSVTKPEIKSHSQTAATEKAKPAIGDITSTEVQDDIKQAVRVKQAAKALIDSGDARVTMADVEHSVLSALDRKFERKNVKKDLLQQTELQPQMQLQPVALEQALHKSESVPEPTTLPYSPALMHESTRQLTQQEQQKTVTSVQPTTETAAQQGKQENKPTQTRPQSYSPATQQTIEEAEDDEELHEEEIEREEEELRKQLLLELEYERDEALDQMRQEVAVQTAQIIFDRTTNESIDGTDIAESLVSVYEPLVSMIVPSGRPDDHLTDIIEKVAERKYRSVSEVFTAVHALTRIFPAVTVGRRGDITRTEAERLRNSYRFPRGVR
jgi:hypothetical protein